MVYVLLIIGFLLLIKGADVFIDGTISVAKKLKIPSMIIGLTIVAMGTSAPEAAVSIVASYKGSAGIAVGNIVGSNIFNLLIVIGICLLFVKMDITNQTLKRDYPIYFVAMGLLLFFSRDLKISRIEGIILFVVIILYMYTLVRHARNNKTEEDNKERPMGAIKSIIYIVTGGAAIIYGGDLVVNKSVIIAETFGFSEQFIGLSIVAVGTSLPELVTSLTAIKKGENDLAIGNVVGSNIFNILFVLGIASSIAPIQIDMNSIFDQLICIAVSIIVYLVCFKKKQLGKVMGSFMILMYAGFFAYIFLR